MKSIHDEKSCKDASKHFEKQSNWVQVKPDDKGDTRPIGCSWHNDKLLQLWKKSSGKCNVDGYDGCFCVKTIGKYNLFEHNGPNIYLCMKAKHSMKSKYFYLYFS